MAHASNPHEPLSSSHPYSTERRTALLLSGTGAHGAYHAGVLRAVREAGIKIDVMAGHGMGAVAAALAAIDGAATLWDAEGLWRSPPARSLYGWKRSLRVAGWLTIALAVVVLSPALFMLVGTNVPSMIQLLAMTLGAAIILTLLGGTIVSRLRGGRRRRYRGNWWWGILAAPLDVDGARAAISQIVWKLIRGAASANKPDQREIGRRYGEVLAESLGQPGVRELVIIANDVDARHDITAALLREPFRRQFFAPRLGRERKAEAIDLAGAGREYALDVICAAITPGVGGDPYVMAFPPDSYWRGEAHRLCDRPGTIIRLFDELHAAGVEQVIIASGVTVQSAPHRLKPADVNFRRRIGDFVAAAESASLHDALVSTRSQFAAVYLVSPEHNAIGPLDFAGAYDEASDRQQTLAELIERGYEDAHRQFIAPVVAASGEYLHIGDAHGEGILHHVDPQR